MMKFFTLAFVALLFSGCAVQPTKIQVNSGRKLTSEPVAGLSDLQFNENTVVVDARPAFLYSMSHVPRSISLQWDEFSQDAEAQKGVLQSDLFAVSRRLARLGISPSARVIVVGNGVHGAGQEGRLAWMFKYLGINNVDYVDIQAIRGKLDHTDIDPGFAGARPKEMVDEDESVANAKAQARQSNATLKAVQVWKPQLNESLLATRDEVLTAINKSAAHQPMSYQGQTARAYRFIDVRSEAEYLGKDSLGLSRNIPDIGAINIEWKQFLTTEGRPNIKFRAALTKVGISPEERIIVIDNQGVTAGAVTLALQAMGFSHAANYAGGWNDLLSVYTAPKQ